MPTLTIRNVDEATHQALRERAAANGRSMEAELRAMLAERVAEPPLTPAELLRRIRARGLFLPDDFELPPREAPKYQDYPDFSGPEWDHLDDAPDEAPGKDTAA